MSNALKSFLGGMAGGYITESNRQEDAKRKDKQDALREQEFDLRKRQLEGQLADQDQARADKAFLREPDTAAQPIDEWTQSTEGKTPEEVQKMKEDMSMGIPSPAVQAGVRVGDKSFLKTPRGMEEAKSYGISLNSDDEKAKRYAKKLEQVQGPQAAQDYLSKWQVNKEALNAARLQALKRVGLEKIAVDDFSGVADLYNNYNDGKTAVYEPGQDGFGAFAIYQGDPKDGKRLSTISFKNRDELAGKFISVIDPVEAAKLRSAAALEASKARVMSPGQQLVQNGKAVYSVPERTRVGGIGGGSRSGGGQEPGRMDYSQGVKFNDVYQKNLAFQLDRLKGDPLMGGEPPNEEQVDQAAKTAYAMTAQQMGAIKTGSRKAEQEGAISKALFPLRSGRGADPDKYAGVRAQLLDRGYSDAVMTAMGYPPPSGAFSVVKDGKMISRGTSAR